MIDTKKCSDCNVIKLLLENGRDPDTINEIAKAGMMGSEPTCSSEPVIMEGGWQKCFAPPLAKAALRGVAQADKIDQRMSV